MNEPRPVASHDTLPPARPAPAHTPSPTQPGRAIPPVPTRPLPSHDPHEDAIALEDDPMELAGAETAQPPSKIKMFGTTMAGSHGGAQHKYKRSTNVDGHGACRVRSFHGRLSDEGMAFMDDKVNEWLDTHPDIEVKFVTTAVGLYDGKIKEQALVVNVWY